MLSTCNVTVQEPATSTLKAIAALSKPHSPADAPRSMASSMPLQIEGVLDMNIE